MTSPNEALTATRETLHLSQEDLARAINRVGAQSNVELRCSARQIAKWEAGAIAWPQPRYRRALEAVTGVPCSMLGFVPPNKHDSSADGENHPDEEGDEVQRRQFMTAAAAGAASLINPFRTGDALAADRSLDEIHTTLLELAKLERKVGSGLLLPLINAQIARLTEKLAAGKESTALRTIAARAHEIAGWMHFDSGHQDKARTLERGPVSGADRRRPRPGRLHLLVDELAGQPARTPAGSCAAGASRCRTTQAGWARFGAARRP